MHTWNRVLAVFAVFRVILGQELRWESPWTVEQCKAPEPRAFASLAGLPTRSKLYLYGGYSHARNAWLGDVWSQSLDGTSSASNWEQLAVEPGDLDEPLEHATLAAMSGALVLIGGRFGNGTFNDGLYLLNPDQPTWRRLRSQASSGPTGPERMPVLYWHSAVPYEVDGSIRLFVCGGLDGNGSAVDRAYEFSYDNASNAYSYMQMSRMPLPLFGHSLAVGGNSQVYLSGGLTGAFTALPRGAVPPGLRAALEVEAPGPAGQPAAHLGVYQFSRAGSDGVSGGTGAWSLLGTTPGLPRAIAFHTSWVKDSALYLYGGAQSASVGANATTSGAIPFGLQVFQLPAGPASEVLAYSASLAQDALAQWGAVQPGALSAAAAWLDTSASASSTPTLWLFGGWATPQPLPAQADVYLAPQDSSLLWRWDGGAGALGAAGQWLPPLQGGIAPRGGGSGPGGMMMVPVTVAGARKLLGVGGRVQGGWTGQGGGSRFLTDSSQLQLNAGTDPRAAATSYHLNDIWLIDLATGARQTVWLVNITAGCLAAAVSGSGVGNSSATNCTSLPFGTALSPTALGPVWDRRLMEVPSMSGGRNATPISTVPGGSNQALYIHAVEVLGANGAPSLQVGIWRLTISVVQLPTAAGNVNVYAASWRGLTPSALPDSSACYPRTLYGAATLTSPTAAVAAANSTGGSSATAHVALHGGLSLVPSAPGSDGSRFLATEPTDSVCLFDISMRRWLAPPAYPKGFAPEARYRHACAARPGLCSYSMTCFGGVSGASGAVLGDAWTFWLLPGLVPGQGSGVSMPQHAGNWTMAPANYSAVRPGPRLDHVMMPVRGINVTANGTYIACAASAPVLLLGGALTANSSSAGQDAATGPAAPRQDLWMLEASCADPDAVDAVAALAGGGPSLRPQLASQVWLNVIPNGSIAAAVKAGAADPWAVAAAGVLQSEGGMEVWTVLLSTTAPDQPRAVRMVSPPNGCLSLRPSCTRLAFAFDNSSVCWPGATQLGSIRVDAATGVSVQPSGSGLLSGSVGFAVLGQGGVPLHFRDNTLGSPTDGGYWVNNVVIPPGTSAADLTVVAYGRPYVEIERSPVTTSETGPPKALVALNCTSLALTVRSFNSTPVANLSVEIRVLYNGLYRKRRCVTYPPTTDCDLANTSGSGVAAFQVFPIQPTQPVPVSYVVIASTPYYYGQYVAVLPSPIESANGGSSSSTGANGGVVTLLPGGGPTGYSISYKLDLPSPVSPSPPPDGRVSVNVTISFRPSLGYSALHLPNNRRWITSFYRYVAANSIESAPSLNISDAYSTAAKVFPRRLAPGNYLIQVTDSVLPSTPLYELSRNIDAGSASVTLDVVMASVTFRVYFSRVVVSPGAGFTVGASSVFVALYTVGEGSTTNALELYAASGGSSASGGLGVADMAWDSELTDGGIATFSLIPDINYLAVFSYPSYPSMVLKGPVPIRSPALTGGNSGGGNSGSGSVGGGAAVYELELQQTLLCGAGTTTIINLQRGKFPADGIGSIVYGPGTVCTWVIITGQPLMNLIVNTTGMAPGDALYVITDSGATTRLPSQLDTGNVFSVRIATTNVTLRFRANNDSVMGSGPIVSWEGMDAATSMPPQFIMMIAASAAAAGAMLLFLCLWHCVFRPVQLRRQAQAAALSAAAAEATGGAAQGTRVAVHRNRVPRRYLRMMETSTYSVKGAAVNAPVADVVPVPNGIAPPAADADTAPADNAPPAAAGGDQASSPEDSPAGKLEALGGEVCAICLCEFEDGDRLRHLPCRHFYHVPCIEQWLGRDVTCPLCKDNVLEAMRTLFGPLPPRNSSRQAAAAAAAAATAPPAPPRGGDGAAPEAAAREASASRTPGEGALADGGTAGAGTVTGVGGHHDLEMVVIIAPGQGDGTAAADAGSHGVQATGSAGEAGNGTGPLPGSTASWHGAPSEGRQATRPLSPSGAGTAAAGGARAAADGGGAVEVRTPRSSASRVLAAPAAASLQSLTSAQSRDLRALPSIATQELTEEIEGSSTDSDSNSDDDSHEAVERRTAQAVTGRGLRAGSAGPHPAAGGSGGSGGNQLLPVSSAAQVTATGSASASWVEASSRVPSPRPVTEGVQHSLGSGSSAVARRSGASTQVVPVPRPPLPHPPPAAVATPTPQRLPRAQEAQLAVAAAAASVAAASVSAGGSGGSARHFGAGAAEPRPMHSSVSAPPVDTVPAIAAGLQAYRIHNNPLATHHVGPISTGSSISDLASPHETDRSNRGSTNGHVSVTMGSPGYGRSNQGSVGGAGGSNGVPGSHLRSAGVLAVPEVSGASDDMIRTPSVMARVGAPGAPPVPN